MVPYESIHRYIEKSWELHLQASIYKRIDFEEQKQYFYISIIKEAIEYVNSQRPKTIFAIIHHSTAASNMQFQKGRKRISNPMEVRD